MIDHHEDTSAEHENLERYRRQLAIDGWGEVNQGKLTRAHVTVVGAGGLGSPVLLYLAAAGVGHIRIIDGDTVALSNLNRQVLYGDSLIDRPKAEAAAARLRALNPSIEIEAFIAGVDVGNSDSHLPTEGILVDCLDNFDTRFILNRHAVANHLPLVHAGVEGFYGQLTTIIPGETPCLECIFAGLEGGTTIEGEPSGPPVLGAVVGSVGCLQALEVIKLITGLGSPLKDRLLIFDGLNTHFDEIPIKRNDKCAVCAV